MCAATLAAAAAALSVWAVSSGPAAVAASRAVEAVGNDFLVGSGGSGAPAGASLAAFDWVFMLGGVVCLVVGVVALALAVRRAMKRRGEHAGLPKASAGSPESSNHGEERVYAAGGADPAYDAGIATPDSAGGGVYASGAAVVERDGGATYDEDYDDDGATYQSLVMTRGLNSAEAATRSDNLITDVVLGDELGKGAFGAVFRATLQGHNVAVKQIRGGSDEDEFMKELGVMLKLKNRRIVTLYGVMRMPNAGGLGLVMELCALGSLDALLKRHEGQVPLVGLVQICVHIAEGLAYLAEQNILHRDLAVRNVLVDKNSNCKLADFGLSRFVDDDNEVYVATSAFPVRWTAPETLTDHLVTKASDVYALAITMWEVFAYAKLPYGELRKNTQVAQAVVAGKRPDRPPSCESDGVWQCIEAAWVNDDEARPSAQNVARALLQELVRLQPELEDVYGTTSTYDQGLNQEEEDDLLYAFVGSQSASA